MNTGYLVRTLILASVAALLASLPSPAQAQSGSSRVTVERDSVTIAPPAGAHEFRVEIFSSGGRSVFDTGLISGQPFVWNLSNAQGQSVPEGLYLFLVSTTDAKGKVRKTIEQVSVLRKPSEKVSKSRTTNQTEALQDSSGTPGQIAKWTAPDTLGDSVVTEDSSKIGIANLTPMATLHVNADQPPPSSSTGTEAVTLLLTSGGKGGDGTDEGAIAGKGADVSLLAGSGGDAPVGKSGGGGNITIQPGLPGAGAISGQSGRLLLAPFGGNVGVGALSPSSKLTVEGNVQISGAGNGLKFPDGTLQTTAAATSISHDATLSGDGSTASPLRVSVPLSLSGSEAGGILSVANAGSGPAITTMGAINTSGFYSIGGSRVLSTSGINSLFAGVGAGANNSGESNTFVGSSAGQANTIGNFNTFFGNRAGLSNISGTHNTMVGSDAGAFNTTGFWNSFFGLYAGRFNTTGYANSFFGLGAGFNNTLGARNCFFGREAGVANTIGGFNSFFGDYAGGTNSTGSGNTFIGGAAIGTANLKNATAIGYSAKVEQDNSLVLGSINGVNYATASVNVGIGTTTPTSRLEVRGGEIKSSGSGGGVFTALNPNNQGAVVYLDWFNDGTKDWPRIRYGGNGEGSTNGFLIQGTSNNTKLAILHNGNIGIGTSAPASRLHVIGNAIITGNLSKGSGSFKIDHPLDPANKYLSHSFVESPDMMNIYNGSVTTDKRGRAVVRLPAYFAALNSDFRYQLTCIGQFAQAIVREEIKDNQFVIKTSRPLVKVSWQVTGIRRDAYANANRLQVEEDKLAEERGTYLHPELFGQTAQKTVAQSRLGQVKQSVTRNRRR